MKPKGHDIDRFILMRLLKEGPLNLKELEEKTNILFDQFFTFGINLAYNIIPLRIHLDKELYRRRDKKQERDFDAENGCGDLIKRKMII